MLDPTRILYSEIRKQTRQAIHKAIAHSFIPPVETIEELQAKNKDLEQWEAEARRYGPESMAIKDLMWKYEDWPDDHHGTVSEHNRIVLEVFHRGVAEAEFFENLE